MLARLFYIFKVIKSETCTLVDNPHFLLRRVKHYVPRNPTLLCVIHNIFFNFKNCRPPVQNVKIFNTIVNVTRNVYVIILKSS